MKKSTSSNRKPNYLKVSSFLANKKFDESYALLTHYILLQGSDEANKYKDLLTKHGIDINKLPTKEQYVEQLKIPFVPTEKKFTFIDLFAGIGGFRLAMQKLGGTCVFSSEFDEAAKQTYFENYGEVPFGDITLPEIKKLIPKKIDVLCAGFPCQPFSFAGKRRGFEDKTKGTLFFDVCDIIKESQPQAFFLENVKGIVSHDNGKTIETIRNILTDELGYDIHESILSSLDFGLPQKRERWYCVGFKKKTNFTFPKGTKKDTVLRDIVDLENNDPSLKLSDFETQRIKYHFEHADKIRVEHDNSKYAPNTKKRKYGVFSFQKADGSLRFYIGDSAKSGIQEAFYSCLDTYAPTIIATRPPKLWDIERKLSIRESARLQGFPDRFRIPVSDAQGYKQFGNSVSVPVLIEIAKNMTQYLNLNKD